MVRSQSCSATVFGTDLPETHPSSSKGLFINTQSPASCSGILTLWHYCFYNEDAGSKGRARFAIYRRDSASSYSRVYIEQEILLMIPNSPDFTCDTLTPSESSIQVHPEDIIVACSDSVDMLSEDVSGYEVFRSKATISTCSETDLPDFFPPTDDSYELTDLALHVFAGKQCSIM